MTNDLYIKLDDVRLSFPSLFEKKVWPDFPDKLPAYEATFILDKVKHAKEIKLIQDRIEAIIAENKISKNKIQPNHMCFKDGDNLDREEYEGCFVLKTKSFNKFPLVNKDLTRVDKDDNVFYPGCHVNTYVALNFYNKKAVGINAKVKSIQFRKDGEPFGEPMQKIEGAYDVIQEDSSEQAYF